MEGQAQCNIPLQLSQSWGIKTVNMCRIGKIRNRITVTNNGIVLFLDVDILYWKQIKIHMHSILREVTGYGN